MVDYTEGSGKQYHVGLGPGDVGRYVLLPGDPKRCAKIAKYFDNPRLVADSREFVRTGGIYVGERADIKPFKSGGTGVLSFLESQPMELPTRLEAGTLNGPGIAGLLAGVKAIEEIGVDNIYAKEHMLMKTFLEKIKKIPGIRIYGDFDMLSDKALHCAIISVNIADMDSAEVSDILMNEYGIATRSGIHCAPLMHKLFGTEKQGMVRFSFSYYNTVEEINEAAAALMQIAAL